MLVVERKYNQSVFLTLPNGKQIKITVVKTEKNKAKLGIEAPQEVVIEREEIMDNHKGFYTQNHENTNFKNISH